MIYCFNGTHDFVKSGIEYAEVYREKIFRKLGLPVKFIFTEMINDNIQSYTNMIGFCDSDIIWLYSFFTDVEICPCLVSVDNKISLLEKGSLSCVENGSKIRFLYPGDRYSEINYVEREKEKYIKTIEYGCSDRIVRLEHYTSTILYSEDFAWKDENKYITRRSFFNKDGSTAFEEIVSDYTHHVFIFSDRRCNSLNELVSYMMTKLSLTKEDCIILDRDVYLEYERAVIENRGEARVGVCIHSEHSYLGKGQNGVRWGRSSAFRFKWNKYYDFIIVSTSFQAEMIRSEIKQVYGDEPQIYVIPVGSIDYLMKSTSKRKPYSLMSASRLAEEKHLEIVIEAVYEAHKLIPEISLDIYGIGNKKAELVKLVNDLKANEYIVFKGYQQLDSVYIKYEAYISGSYTEAFGLTLLEACASGLPIIGFDVRYGNKELITDGVNGIRASFDADCEEANINSLKNAIVKLFRDEDVGSFSEKSYRKAEDYLTEEIEKKWLNCLNLN